jgi:cell wall-associated NlpC family hydrolase
MLLVNARKNNMRNMTYSEHNERDLVVKVAKSWIGTPYHNNAKIKGVGCDCLTFLSGVFIEAGIIKEVKIPHYSPDFMKHRNAEQYLDGLLKYTHEVEKPLPGDIALWKFGRCFSHSAIVVEWPVVMHAYIHRSVMFENVDRAQWLKYMGRSLRPVKYFSYWEDKVNEFPPRIVR